MVKDSKAKELRQIILEDYGLEISQGQALEVASQLTELFEILIYGKEANDGETPKQNTASQRA